MKKVNIAGMMMSFMLLFAGAVSAAADVIDPVETVKSSPVLPIVLIVIAAAIVFAVIRRRKK